MNPELISEIRRRKIARYKQFLPSTIALPLPEDIFDDLSYMQCLATIARVAPPGLALEVGASRRLGDLGLLGYVVLNCADLGETLEIWQNYANMAGELVRLDSWVDEKGSEPRWFLRFKPLPFLPREVARLCSDELCASFFSFGGQITGRDFADFSVELNHPSVPNVDYALYLPGPVSFNRPEVRIAGPATALREPNLSRDPQTFELLLRHLADKERATSKPQDLSLRLYGYFASCIPGRPSLEGAATALGLSKRTLVRRLADEGVTFGSLLDEFRFKAATELLSSRVVSVKQAAHALGFESENSFRRAFTKWSGEPIGRWRRSQASRDRSST